MIRVLKLILGTTLVLAGAALTPVPGPWSLPLVAVGLLLVLRNSLWARRHYILLSRRWPRPFALTNRFLRRSQVAPQQTL